MTTDQQTHCTAAPAGESHRWRIPAQGSSGPALCRWCGAARAFTPALGASEWETMGERQQRTGASGDYEERTTHPAQREGAAAGSSAAIEDRHEGHDRAIAAELVLAAARESAADWTADNHQLVDPAGESVAAYVEAYCDAYDAWYAGQTVTASGRVGKIRQLPEVTMHDAATDAAQLVTEELLSVYEAAQLLGVTPDSLRNFSNQGRLVTLRLPTGKRRYERTELERFRQTLRTTSVGTRTIRRDKRGRSAGEGYGH